jgi:hypothetical protein
MKNLALVLLFLVAAFLVYANASSKKDMNTYEYAFVFIDNKYMLNIHYENGRDTAVKQLLRYNLNKGWITQGFAEYVKAFHRLENQGYELVTSNHTSDESEDATPYFIFRRKTAE